MKVEVEVISTEIIKPSSPTPHHLRHYKLSFLDQLTSKTYNPLVFFYDLKADYQEDYSNISDISNKLKKSLSEVLTLYYPLAGRVKNDRFVDCNDDGVSYSVARVNPTCQFSDAIKKSLPSDLCKFLPFELHKLKEYALGVQLNVFEGGGIAVGLCVSHQLADALSCIMFVKTWVAIARGGAAHVARPEFVSAKLFPLADDPWFDANAGITKKVITKRFVFEAPAIEAIRSKYDDKKDKRRPSRVESLSTFILSLFVAATREDDEDSERMKREKVCAAILPVNLRTRIDPPLPEHAFGNLSRCAVAAFPEEESDTVGVVRKIREGIRKVDMDYLKTVQQGEDLNMRLLRETSKKITMRGGKFISFCFTSLFRFPVYEADFGWGEPTWVSSASMCFDSIVAFMDTKTGNGIEAYIALKEDFMVKLEADEEFFNAVYPVGC